MFGYVLPPLSELPEAEAARFQRIYCGLCHVLGNRCGPAARFVLNYDFTFLAILLLGSSELQELPELSEQSGLPKADRPRLYSQKGRCIASPVRRREYQPTNAALELAADESVILAYWQIQDGMHDFHGPKRLKYAMASGFLTPAYRRAASRCPEFDSVVRQQLEQLETLEQIQCASIDRAADTFAVLLSKAAGTIENETRRRILEQMLYHLGRWVYLIDAADDLKEDAISGNYNPVALRYQLKDGCWTVESRREFAQSLDHSVRMIATAFELWDFGVWRPILERTIYQSLFQVGKAVLDGTFRESYKKRRNHKRKNQRKAEETSA